MVNNTKWVIILEKKRFIWVIILSVVSILAFTIASTYAVIIEVTEKDGVTEIVNSINIRDLLTSENGNYNNTYYNVINELDIVESEAILLMESVALNEVLQKVLDSVVEYRLNNNLLAKYSDIELYNLIESGVYETDTISDSLKDKVNYKCKVYISDVSNFLYDIEVNKVGG